MAKYAKGQGLLGFNFLVNWRSDQLVHRPPPSHTFSFWDLAGRWRGCQTPEEYPWTMCLVPCMSSPGRGVFFFNFQVSRFFVLYFPPRNSSQKPSKNTLFFLPFRGILGPIVIIWVSNHLSHLGPSRDIFFNFKGSRNCMCMQVENIRILHSNQPPLNTNSQTHSIKA